ncbi:linear amide C-N hydrolase [Xanthobacter sp. TB0139]|uniref:linear amide C-N hydrolase n=1 Tax=Xanthobacter sp. TB0139 TaxID=3459178 RepID=UPI0040393CFE
MCTSLLYRDAANRAYLGRTLELSLDLPYQVTLFPKGQALSSTVQGHPALNWEMRHATIAVTMPSVPTAALDASNLKVIEGLNDAGLTFSVQSYPQADGPQAPVDAARAALSAADIGAWVLGQFSTVAEVKAALEDMPVVLEPVPLLGGLAMPFHYGIHDPSGASLVIEFHHGVRTIYDNPVGVMTNAPQFPWHLTNLNNYTFLNNVNHAKATFGAYQAVQPGTGIAKAGLPGTDTSVDRFIRAAFYAQFAEKQTDPDKAVQMVAHIMNNFDRPRGITVDQPNLGSDHLHVTGHDTDGETTESTSWTSIADLDRRLMFLRDAGGMNYACLDVTALAGTADFRTMPMARLLPGPVNVSPALAGA